MEGADAAVSASTGDETGGAEEKPASPRKRSAKATEEPAADAAPKRRGRPRKKKADEDGEGADNAKDGEGNELPAFLMASNG